MVAPGELVSQKADLLFRKAECLGRFSYCRFITEGADCGDEGNLIFAVGSPDVFQDFIPPSATEIEVDVGRIGPGRI